jgi:hypothetical protein
LEEAEMAFDVGPTMQTIKGYGFAIRNAHRGPITFIEFVTKAESEIAEAQVREAIRNAVSVTDTQGRKWTS